MLCFVGYSGVGKTTLVSRLIAELTARGRRIGAIKRSSHGFQMDREGKDTRRFRAAGARAVAIASPTEWALIASLDAPIDLHALAHRLPAGLELIVVEGFKSEAAPKVWVDRAGFDRPPASELREDLCAVVTDRELEEIPAGLPRFAADAIGELADWVEAWAHGV
jgi:molybdopterin-guanine dinucleotide biosynthesis protein B